MIIRLINFVASPPPGNNLTLSLQDVALCRFWALAQEKRAPLDHAGQSVVHAVNRWISNPPVPDLKTSGKRHQPLIRELVDLIKHSSTDALSVEEAGFLATTLALARESGEHPATARSIELLQAHESALTAKAAVREPTSGLVTLERRIQYATENDILKSDVNFIRLMAGIELPCRGPVFKASSNLRVLGDVPEGCTVVVENDGCCCVDGYVMGRVLSKHQCEIRHNISGVAIVLTGHIRARGVINNALVVSKMGSVVCMNAQGPRLVFAGQSIDIEENALLGRFITRNLRVGREVRGSRLEITGEASAHYFRHLGMSNVAVVLRRELSCTDFGEVTGAELNQLLSRAYALRRHARNFSHLARAARREADHSAQSVLMFIFGGGEVQKRLESLLRAQRRHAFIANVVLNLQDMLDDASAGQFQESGEPATTGYSPSATATPIDDLDDEELKIALAETATLESSLRSRALDRRQTTLLLDTVRQKLEEMTALRAQMAEQVVLEERAMQNMEKYEQILAGNDKGASKIEILNRILPALQNQPPESPVGKRLRASFSVLALRNVERATRHAADFERKATENLTNFRAVSEQLGKDYQIRILENPEDEGCAARVTGRFEPGARIFMDEYVENIADASPDALIITPDDNGLHTYLRKGSGSRFHTAE